MITSPPEHPAVVSPTSCASRHYDGVPEGCRQVCQLVCLKFWHRRWHICRQLRSDTSSKKAIQICSPRPQTFIKTTSQHMEIACSDHLNQHIREIFTFNAERQLVLSVKLISPRWCQYRVRINATWQPVFGCDFNVLLWVGTHSECLSIWMWTSPHTPLACPFRHRVHLYMCVTAVIEHLA